MAQTIEVGTLFIKDGTHLPETLAIESDPYLKGWSRVKNLSCSALDRKLTEVGWTFFFMAGEVTCDGIRFEFRKNDPQGSRERHCEHEIGQIQLLGNFPN